MDLQAQYENLLNNIPDSQPANPTFMEIAGFPHYENVCSNILKFYFNSSQNTHKLDGLVLKSFLQAIPKDEAPFTEFENLTVRREVVTSTGRLDLLLFTSKWVIAIENKIYHLLNNDLEEYARYLENAFPNHEKLKVVLSLRTEKDPKGGFINLTYKEFIKTIEENLGAAQSNSINEYLIFLRHFLSSIKKMYMPETMEKEVIEFLFRYEPEIDRLIELQNKLNDYIGRRVNAIVNEVNVSAAQEKKAYGYQDAVFYYRNAGTTYKLECYFEWGGVSILACVEGYPFINKVELSKLDYFKKHNIEKFESNSDRVFIESDINFFTDDKNLIDKMQTIVNDFKISSPNE